MALFWSYTWKPVKFGSAPILHLKASQPWFCSGLTLESQSTLALFWSYTWKPINLGFVPVLHLKASHTWFCSGLTLESQSHLVLFRSYAWKLVTLGSVPVLHLKASHIWFCFAICLLTWTYPWLPFFLSSSPTWVPAWLVLQSRWPIKEVFFSF